MLLQDPPPLAQTPQFSSSAGTAQHGLFRGEQTHSQSHSHHLRPDSPHAYLNQGRRQALIDWVNSLEGAGTRCLLASAPLDFQDGTVFCEIVKALLTKRGHSASHLLSRVVPYPRTPPEELLNISLAHTCALDVAVGPALPQMKHLAPEAIRSEETALFQFLDFLRLQH